MLCVKKKNLTEANINCHGCELFSNSICCFCGKRKADYYIWISLTKENIKAYDVFNVLHYNYLSNTKKDENRWGKKICKTCYKINNFFFQDEMEE